MVSYFDWTKADDIIEDAKHRLKECLGSEEQIYYSSLEVYSWPQSWGDTSCGFGGYAGQSMTTAQTFVIIYGMAAVVYHGGHYAYMINKANKEFYERFGTMNLPGAAGNWRALDDTFKEVNKC